MILNKTFTKNRSKNGQNIIEYSVLAVLVISGIIIMGPYVARSWFAFIKGYEDSVKDSVRDPLEQTNERTGGSECVCGWTTPQECTESAPCCGYPGCPPGHSLVRVIKCNHAECPIEEDPFIECVANPKCCTPWQNGGCGEGTCDGNMANMYQTRTCPDPVTGIPTIEQACLIEDSRCGFHCNGGAATDPIESQKYDAFCDGDDTDLTQNINTVYVAEDGCSDPAKCQFKCKSPFVPTFTEDGTPLGCNCPPGGPIQWNDTTTTPATPRCDLQCPAYCTKEVDPDTGEEDCNCPVRANRLAVNDHRTCIIKDDKKVYCYPASANSSNNIDYPTSTTLPGVAQADWPLAKSIAVSKDAVLPNYCVLRDDGNVTCWKYHDDYTTPFSNPNTDIVNFCPNSTPTTTQIAKCSQAGTAKQVVVDNGTTCVLWGVGQVHCWMPPLWGNSNFREKDLSNPDTVHPFIKIALSAHAANPTLCGITLSGNVVCLAINNEILYGLNNSYQGGIDDAVDISASQDHVCVATRSGKVYCWGLNMYGQVDPFERYIDGAGREMGLCGMVTNPAGSVSGCEVLPQFGDPVTEDNEIPFKNGKAISVSVTYRTSCALLDTGSVVCWGNNFSTPGTATIRGGFIGDSTGHNNEEFDLNEKPWYHPNSTVFEPYYYDDFKRFCGNYGEVEQYLTPYEEYCVCSPIPPGYKMASMIAPPAPECEAYNSARIDDIDMDDFSACVIHENGNVRCWGSFFTTEDIEPRSTLCSNSPCPCNPGQVIEPYVGCVYP